MQLIRHHHHFKADLIAPEDKVAICERYVIDILLTSQLPDSKRENSIAWELKHHAGVAQMARLLARKRGLEVDVCTIGALLHDIYAIVYGTYKDHAHLGAAMATEIATSAGFSSRETDVIQRIVYNHSDKHIWSDDPYAEFGKDADILDIFLYPGPFAEYLLIKSVSVFKHYLDRASSVWSELGIPPDPRFRLLANYGPSWFDAAISIPTSVATTFLSCVFEVTACPTDVALWPPAFCFLRTDTDALTFYGNRSSWQVYREVLREVSPRHAWIPKLEGALSAMLCQNPSTGQVPDVFSEVPQFWPANEAASLVGQIKQDESGLIVWPLADVYELPSGSSLKSRLAELGIAAGVQ
jgi:hypothetical protein